MQIEAFAPSTLSNRREGANSAREPSASTTDVAFFTSMLEPSTARSAASVNNSVSTMLTETSNHLTAAKSRLARALKASTNGLDADTLRKYPRELSHTTLTSQLLTKSLGKATQCIDKICNLQ
ncbi:type III secretion apparatus protein RspB [Pseudomonas yamanorum]|uniref:Type III secretion apparatus protein RspB n=2 Tax=Pseudomonas TaxID=286 RepID=A0A7Y8JNV7_9PSED|nr:EscI/YscI/HrpB family type III secretion system inner rod protein [Pseudomonas yamanorum]NWE13098.1 type III secretion apparatus protein RspB [Pseudomonas yamanorum]NWE43652.1 type III secretion apparatus protein RspB [Pseudomonas yamanorum]NWE79517.1 type III secretion apparatus protein RspB [Pseudomonas yamanorum]